MVRFDPAASPRGNEISPGVAQCLAATDDVDVIDGHPYPCFSANQDQSSGLIVEIP